MLQSNPLAPRNTLLSCGLLTGDMMNCSRTHRGIVHGGMSAMIIDEALGALVYLLKRDGVLGSGVALTAQLEIKYKKVSNTIWSALARGAQHECAGRNIGDAHPTMRRHSINAAGTGLYNPNASDCDASLPCRVTSSCARIWLLSGCTCSCPRIGLQVRHDR